MDLTNIILGQSNSCFLCFKDEKSGIHLQEHIEIQEEKNNFQITLQNIVNFLFPFYDIISSKSCNRCTDVVTKIYLLIRNGLTKLKMVNILMDNIFQAIDSDSKSNGRMVIRIGKEDVNSEIQQEPEFYEANNQTLTHQKRACKSKSNQKPLTCEICSKQFKSLTSLQKHLQSHTRITCPYCQKSLKNNSFYKTHLKTHTISLKRSSKTLHCVQCSYTTKNLSNLKSHMNKNHLNIRPYICDVCKNGFYSKSNLVEHLKIHNRKNDLICEFCGESFAYKKTLKQHLNLHNGLRPYKCEICSRSFITISRKNEHAKRHLGKIFTCSFCPKNFSLKKELNQHNKVHCI